MACLNENKKIIPKFFNILQKTKHSTSPRKQIISNEKGKKLAQPLKVVL
jgi:hypothetical protein